VITRVARRLAREADGIARFARYRWVPADRCRCGAAATVELGRTRIHGRAFSLLECTECGLGRLSPRLADDDLVAYYARDYRRSGAVDAAYFERGVRRGRRLREFLARNGIEVAAGSSVVEPGTGAGGILAAFRDAGHQVAGSDLDPACVAYATEQGLPVAHGELVPLDLAASPAGLVVLSHFVEHLPEPLETIRSLDPWIGSETLVYVEVPGLRSGVAPAAQVRIPHLFYYDLRTLQALFDEAGYELVTGTEDVRAVFRRAS